MALNLLSLLRQWPDIRETKSMRVFTAEDIRREIKRQGRAYDEVCRSAGVGKDTLCRRAKDEAIPEGSLAKLFKVLAPKIIG